LTFSLWVSRVPLQEKFLATPTGSMINRNCCKGQWSHAVAFRPTF